MSILVTGGAGYIGAHVVRLLLERGEKVVVVDNLTTGAANRIGDATLIKVDVARDEALPKLTQAMIDEDVTGVIHFAAQKQVGESVERPAWYYRQNIGGLANVLLAMEEAGVKNMIFSSSAAVYGMPPVPVIPEDIEKKPINPYGETKLIGEWMMADAERAWGLNWIGLRYFNVAGAGWNDLADPACLNLVPMVLDRLARVSVTTSTSRTWQTHTFTLWMLSIVAFPRTVNSTLVPDLEPPFVKSSMVCAPSPVGISRLMSLTVAPVTRRCLSVIRSQSRWIWVGKQTTAWPRFFSRHGMHGRQVLARSRFQLSREQCLTPTAFNRLPA